MAQPATVAAVERVVSWCMCQEFDHRRSALLDAEAVFIRSEHEAGIALRVGPIGIEINFEAVSPIESR
jgi:hypothetical protein